nr:trna wybutosine-synthesizing protein 2/3/4 [Quercus suber]
MSTNKGLLTTGLKSNLEDSAATLSHDFFHTSRRLSLTQLLHNQSSLTPGSLFQRANAKLVYACEWNPNAIEALQHNLQANSVSDCSIVLEGDNRITPPKGVADHVCLGLIATSEGSWVTAVKALSLKHLKCPGNVSNSEQPQC